ncbi:MAG: GyrI-like domain-containing protein [Anaerolineae bacterium]
MDKVDFKKALQHLYNPSSRDFSVVEVPEMQFLMVDGHGDPNTEPAYQEAVESLYAVAYKLKFMSKQRLEKDYTVPPLEGLWWAADMDSFTVRLDKSAWDWTMMIMQPEWITPEMFAQAVAEVQKIKASPALSKMRLERYAEGLSVQILHIGSYDDEAPTLARLHREFIPQNGYVEAGKHHEIYLGDPRKTAPEKLKTVLRQPVARR